MAAAKRGNLDRHRRRAARYRYEQRSSVPQPRPARTRPCTTITEPADQPCGQDQLLDYTGRRDEKPAHTYCTFTGPGRAVRPQGPHPGHQASGYAGGRHGDRPAVGLPDRRRHRRARKAAVMNTHRAPVPGHRAVRVADGHVGRHPRVPEPDHGTARRPHPADVTGHRIRPRRQPLPGQVRPGEPASGRARP